MQHFTVMQQPRTLLQQQHALKPDDRLTLSTYIADTKSSLLTRAIQFCQTHAMVKAECNMPNLYHTD